MARYVFSALAVKKTLARTEEQMVNPINRLRDSTTFYMHFADGTRLSWPVHQIPAAVVWNGRNYPLTAVSVPLWRRALSRIVH